MELLDWAKRLVEAGALTILVLLVVAIFVGLWRRWWVPGFWYDEKVAALKDAVTALAEVTAANVELRIENARLRAENARERRRRRDDAEA